MGPRVLITDPDNEMNGSLAASLLQAGFRVESASTGVEAIKRLRECPAEVLLLELDLPDVSGEDVCRLARMDEDLENLRIIIVSRRSRESDRTRGFEVGADDYVTKPFSIRELILRIRAVLRGPSQPRQENNALSHGPLRLDLDRHRCFVDDQEVALTSREFRLLNMLMEQCGRVISRDGILREIWGARVTVGPRTIDTHLKNLRSKLGHAGDLIETVRGAGYRFSN
jgi:two-component system phosphate regulon response regulator PhoB